MLSSSFLLLLGCGSLEGAGVVDDTSSLHARPYATIPLGGCSWHHTATLEIGDQEMVVLVDTGSGTLAISAAGCSTCTASGVTALYDPSHGEATGQSAENRYGTGVNGWSGEVFRDAVSIGGVEPVEMQFAAVSDQDGMFGTYGCDSADGWVEGSIDGILGLREDESVAAGTDAYLGALVEDGRMKDSFAVRLCHSGGTLWLGGFEDGLLTGEMAYTAMTPDYGDSVYVGGIEVLGSAGERTLTPISTEEEYLPGFLDTGGPCLLFPDDAYTGAMLAITADPAFALLGDSGWWNGDTPMTSNLVPTELDARLPRLIIHIAGSQGIELDLPATESYVRSYDNGDGTWEYWVGMYPDSVIGEGWEDFVDLASLPMYSYVLHVDRDAQAVGFAPASPCL